MGRQQLDISNDVAQIENRCNECTILDIESGVVCATDGKNYQNMCQLKQTSCKLLRRQGEWVRFPYLIFSDKEFFFNWFIVSGRSFQSSQLALEVSHTGPCKSPCPGMESLGQFQAFGVRATNFGKIFQPRIISSASVHWRNWPNVILMGGKQFCYLLN